MWDTIFSAANILAMIAWAALILLPRGDVSRTLIFYLGMAMLCFIYALLCVLMFSGAIDPGLPEGADSGSFTSIEGVRNLFNSDGNTVTAWIHYLAFDLFVGLWIARDADAKNFSRILQAPILLLTYLLGPLGLCTWLVIREPAARRANPRKSKLKL